MYTLISAIGEPLNSGGRWTNIEIGTVAMNTLYSTYRNVKAILSNTFLDHHVSLDLADIREAHGGKSITFNELLVLIGNGTLPTSDVLPVLRTRYARYADAFHAGYKIQPAHPTISPDADLPPSDKPWLFMTRPDIDYNLFYKSCLVNVNGFFHRTDASGQGIYIQDGMKSRNMSGQNQIGILSFKALGNLEFISIKPEMVYKQNNRQAYRERAYVDLGKDVSNKTVMLVLGGYLHLLDTRTFYRVGDGLFAIDFNNLPLLERYYESRNYIDLSSMQLESTTANDSQIGITNFFRDEAMLAYLTLPQSFFVVLDNPYVFAERKAVVTTKMPDMFISHIRPDYPLVVGRGKVAPYWYQQEDGQYSLTCRDTLLTNPVFHSVDYMKQNSIADSRVPDDPVANSDAFFLQIGSDV